MCCTTPTSATSSGGSRIAAVRREVRQRDEGGDEGGDPDGCEVRLGVTREPAFRVLRGRSLRVELRRYRAHLAQPKPLLPWVVAAPFPFHAQARGRRAIPGPYSCARGAASPVRGTTSISP